MPTIIADSIRAEHDPNGSEPRLRALLDAAIDAIITIDQRGIIESVNPATEKMFGYQPLELLGNNVSMLTPEPHRAQHDSYIQRYLDTGEAHIIGIGREVEALHKNGNLFPIDLTITQFTLNGQRMFTGMLRDISDRRSAERNAQRRLDELARVGRLADLGVTTSTIAHEISQPLTAIVSFAQACQNMLNSSHNDADLMREALRQIAEQGARATDIVGRIRGMAKQRASTTGQVDMNRAISNVLSMLTRQLRSENIKLTKNTAAQAPTIAADSVQVEQIIMNLVINAIDAMLAIPTEDRRLLVNCDVSAGHVHLSVGDNAHGLKAEDVERVFESYFTTKADGMGVGLAISRQLADSNGGKLWAHADATQGTIFHLTFPLHNNSAASET